MTKIKAAFTRALARTPDALEVIGLAVVAGGVAMIFVPAGVIVAGAALCFLGYALGGDDG